MCHIFRELFLENNHYGHVVFIARYIKTRINS